MAQCKCIHIYKFDFIIFMSPTIQELVYSLNFELMQRQGAMDAITISVAKFQTPIYP
jgi:hypothetical protein